MSAEEGGFYEARSASGLEQRGWKQEFQGDEICQMQVLKYGSAQLGEMLGGAKAGEADREAIAATVHEILEAVRLKGDRAVLEYAARFDQVRLQETDLRVRAEEFTEAREGLQKRYREAIGAAKRCVTEFHRRCAPVSWKGRNPHGAIVGESFHPLERVGIYIPSGNVPLVSTVIMTVVPARVARVGEIAVFTPPRRDGSIDRGLLAALDSCGVEEVYRVGGAQAVGAMAYGTETIQPVCKIFGPGNAYVIEAKRQVFGTVGVDLLPGPSEVMVVADRDSDVRYVTADLLAQAEHGVGGRIFLVSTSGKLIDAVNRNLKAEAAHFRHRETIEAVLESGYLAVLVDDLEQAASVANVVAPEHLEILLEGRACGEFAKRVGNAGAILMGATTPAVLGDFAAGPSHTLPTGGSARYSSGLTLADFFRRSSIVEYDESSLLQARAVVEAFSALEDLDAHGRSLAVRFEGGDGRSKEAGKKYDGGGGESFVLPHIESLSPYVPGKQPEDGGWIKLNTNENPYPPSPRVAEAIQGEMEGLRLYPNPTSVKLRQSIGDWLGVEAERVIVGNGSDDVLNLLFRCFCGPGNPAATMTPNYSLYSVLAGIQGTPFIEIPYERSMTLKRDAIIASGANLFLISSPNAPTGVSASMEELGALAEEFSGLVVVDEAYVEFARKSALPLLGRHGNLVIVRTFSKSHSLAGLRVGFALAAPEVIAHLDRVRDSYNVNRLSQVGAMAALSDRAYYDDLKRRIVERRERFRGKLIDRGWFAFPSEANFIFAEPVDGNGNRGSRVAEGLYGFLLERKILVRYFGGSSLTASFLRIGIGKESEMVQLLDGIDQWLSVAKRR